MEAPVLITVVVVLTMLALALTALLLRTRATSQQAVRSARAESEALRSRLEALELRWETTSEALVQARHLDAEETGDASPSAYLITDAGVESAAPVLDRAVLTATLGEPLVKAVALGHGLRRALSAESRNRIRFEVRRETRRARKQRRRETREASRRLQAEQRAADQAA